MEAKEFYLVWQERRIYAKKIRTSNIFIIICSLAAAFFCVLAAQIQKDVMYFFWIFLVVGGIAAFHAYFENKQTNKNVTQQFKKLLKDIIKTPDYVYEEDYMKIIVSYELYFRITRTYDLFIIMKRLKKKSPGYTQEELHEIAQDYLDIFLQKNTSKAIQMRIME